MAWVILWTVQSLGIAALAAVAGRLGARRLRPAVQHVVWQCALACIAAFALAGLGAGGDTSPMSAAAAPTGARPLPTMSPLELPLMPAWVLPAVLFVWAAGSAWHAVRMCWQVRRIRGLKRSCVVMSGGDLRANTRLWAAAREGRRARFCWCDGIQGPATLGFGRPAIAVPRLQAERLEGSDLEQVLLHELAHVRRRDDWTVLAEQVLAGLMWINPAVHWVSRGLSVAREMACDDWVIRLTSEPVAYARCLTTVAALRAHHAQDRLVAAIVGSRRVLSRRVARAIDVRTRPSVRLSQAALGFAPMVAGIVGVAVLSMPPLVVDGGGPQAAPPGPPEAVLSVRTTAARPASTQRRVPADPAAGPPARAALERPGEAAAVDGQRRLPPPGAEARDLAVPAPSAEAGRVRPAAESRLEQAALDPVFLPPPHAREAGDLLMAPSPSLSQSSRLHDAGDSAWWSKASGAAGKLGDGAAAAGRSTASFFRRVGGVFSNPFAP
ncbi:MAG: M56 family metallopeptidase [Acidobacteriota bacterium]